MASSSAAIWARRSARTLRILQLKPAVERKTGREVSCQTLDGPGESRSLSSYLRRADDPRQWARSESLKMDGCIHC
jgi:hypothetical protein